MVLDIISRTGGEHFIEDFSMKPPAFGRRVRPTDPEAGGSWKSFPKLVGTSA